MNFIDRVRYHYLCSLLPYGNGCDYRRLLSFMARYSLWLGVACSSMIPAPLLAADQNDPAFFQDSDNSASQPPANRPAAPQANHPSAKNAPIALPVSPVTLPNLSGNGASILPDLSLPGSTPPAPLNHTAAGQPPAPAPSVSTPQAFIGSITNLMDKVVNQKKQEKQGAAPETIPAVPTVPAPEVEHGPFHINNTSWRGSLMFSKQAIDSLNDAIYNRTAPKPKLPPKPTKKSTAGLSSSLGGNAELPAINYPPEAPSFYLNSILYLSPTDWTIWVDNIKVEYPNKTIPVPGFDDLHIVNVSPKQVTFDWQPKMIEYISPGRFTQLSEGPDHTYSNAEGSLILENSANKLHFTLHTNETFSVYDMAIVQGHFGPTTLTPPVVATPQNNTMPSNLLNQMNHSFSPFGNH